jgi:hypothetical protein
MSAIPTAVSVALVGGGIALSNEAPHAGATMAVVGGFGLLIGPSVGHAYGENRFWTAGMTMRVGGLVIAGGGGLLLSAADAEAGIGCVEADCSRNDSHTLQYAVIATGAALFVGGAIYDVATAGSATDRYNASHVTVAPTAIASAHGAVAGVGIGGTF